MQKIKPNPYLTPYTKIDKMDEEPKIRAKTIKTLRRKHRNKSLWCWIWQ